MPKKTSMYEVFDEFQRAPNREVKKQVLISQDTGGLRFILQGAFHPDIQYVFKQPIHYNPTKETVPGMGWQSIYDTMKLVYIWVEGSKKVSPNLRHARKEQLVIQHLESLEPREAALVHGMLMKDLNVKNLTYKLVAETFPGLLPVVDQAPTADASP